MMSDVRKWAREALYLQTRPSTYTIRRILLQYKIVLEMAYFSHFHKKSRLFLHITIEHDLCKWDKAKWKKLFHLTDAIAQEKDKECA